MHDIIIVGGGPAGLTAAVYALRAGKTVLVIEKNGFGGQIAYSPKVENIPGTILISGTEFADALSGSYLAAVKNAPMLLVTNSGAKAADTYAAKCGIKAGYVLGGSGLISDATMNMIFG